MVSPQTHSTSFSISSSQGRLADLLVNLEQIKPPVINQYASISDVYRLWTAALTGRSARSLRIAGCPVEFDGTKIKVYLGFYSWPSNPELLYNIQSAIGSIYSTENVKKDREFSVFVDNTNEVVFDYYMENVRVVWESPSYESDGSVGPHPNFTCYGKYLLFDRSVFGAIRIYGKAVGKYHVCEMILDRELKPEEIPMQEVLENSEYTENGKTYHIVSGIPKERVNGYKIENIRNTITAIWTNEEGKEETKQLQLEIPKCVEELLSICGVNFKYVLLWCQEVSTRQVYYSSCTGEVIEIFDGVDPQSFCSRMESNTDPGPWLKSLLNPRV